MAIPMSSFASALADLSHHRPGIVFDNASTRERRSKIRYPLDLGMRFGPVFGSSLVPGVGRTLNMSSGGVLVFFEHVSLHEIGAGVNLQMSIEWPFLLDNRIPLQFFAVGRILRRGASTFVATFDRHQFRTMRVSRQSQSTSLQPAGVPAIPSAP